MEQEANQLSTVEIEKTEENIPLDKENGTFVPEEKNITKKQKKHHMAKALVAKAKEIVSASDKQIDECKLLLEEDLKAYNEAKATLHANALEQSEALLQELGYDPLEDEEDKEVFVPKEDQDPIHLKDISSGWFSALFSALIAGLLTFGGLLFYAVQKAGIDPQKVIESIKNHDYTALQQVLGEFAKWVGNHEPDFSIGASIVVLITLVVMAIVYFLKMLFKAEKNIRFAKKQLEMAEEYVTYKGSCKEEMDKVDAHIKEAIDTLKDYEILLAEQNGKLRRIMHFEGFKDDQADYLERSRHTMHLTQSLLESIKRFMATPMSEEGKLSGKSTLFLHSAKEKLQKVLKELS